MPKIVIIGSCKHEPYVILAMPNKLDQELYEKDHERAYEEACKVFLPKIKEADEVWVFAPEGIGKHTLKDLEFARKQGIKVMHIVPEKGICLTDTFFYKLYRRIRDEYKGKRK